MSISRSTNSRAPDPPVRPAIQRYAAAVAWVGAGLLLSLRHSPLNHAAMSTAISSGTVASITSCAQLDGGLALIAGVLTPARTPGRLMLLLGGVLGLAVGCLALGWPRLTALALLYLIAVRAMILGVAEVCTAGWLVRDVADAWLLALAGLLSIAFGTVLVLFPATGLLALVWVIGAYSLVIGIVLVATAAVTRTRAGSMLAT